MRFVLVALLLTACSSPPPKHPPNRDLCHATVTQHGEVVLNMRTCVEVWD